MCCWPWLLFSADWDCSVALDKLLLILGFFVGLVPQVILELFMVTSLLVLGSLVVIDWMF
jgi:hypothetical protein